MDSPYFNEVYRWIEKYLIGLNGALSENICACFLENIWEGKGLFFGELVLYLKTNIGREISVHFIQIEKGRGGN